MTERTRTVCFAYSRVVIRGNEVQKGTGMAKCLATTKYADHPWRMRFETWADKSFHAIGFDTGTKRDTALCTCGWNGTPYWDGVNLAWAE